MAEARQRYKERHSERVRDRLTSGECERKRKKGKEVV